MMTRKVKNNWLGGRVDDDLKELVQDYVDSSDMTEGRLIRKAVVEYINNHPVTED